MRSRHNKPNDEVPSTVRSPVVRCTRQETKRRIPQKKKFEGRNSKSVIVDKDASVIRTAKETKTKTGAIF